MTREAAQRKGEMYHYFCFDVKLMKVKKAFCWQLGSINCDDSTELCAFQWW